VQVASALRRAQSHVATLRERLRQRMDDELADRTELAVVLLGRPYTCLSPQMNKGIPEILAAAGVKVFFQDMVRVTDADREEIAELLATVHWHFAAQILTAATVVARTPGLYPVLVQSFKCTPDASMLEYIERIFDRYDKPFLVLELDEHDSPLGYETRIEAGLSAFQNHYAEHRSVRTHGKRQPLHHGPTSSLDQRTLFLPRWDEMACSLIAANLNRVGVPTVLLDETPETTQRAMRLNSGQCTPLTILAQEFIEAVERRGLDPGRTALWTLKSQISCNLGMFASAIRSILVTYGRGFERAAVYTGEISMVDLTVRGTLDVYFAYMLSGYLRKLACRTRPYERERGAADRALTEGMHLLRDAFAGKRDKLDVVVRIVDRFAAIEIAEQRRPKVAIIGDLFTRDNDLQNQGLVRFIERHGGEVVTTPYSEYMKLVAGSYFRKWMREGKIVDVVVSSSLLATAQRLERRFANEFARVLGPEPTLELGQPIPDVLAPFGVTERHTGETLDNLIKVAALLRHEPDLSLIVQANPAYCCPSMVTEAMAARIEQRTGVPVVTVTYDGSPSSRNDIVIPYLAFAETRAAGRTRPVTEVPGPARRRRPAS
jgi:predicted nucleotide-binding protein (sugar kinase/HSP70/actin superfamily)